MSERYVPKQAYTPEQIKKLPNATLKSSLPPEERRLALAEARSLWDSRPMSRRKDESAGEFAVRKREAAKTDQHEYARLQRAALERALYESKGQKLKRLTDAMTASITKESAEADKKVLTDLAQKSRHESFSDGGSFLPGATE